MGLSNADLRFDEMDRAYASLLKALAQPLDEFTRDSVIQRFEFCFELIWKLGKKALAREGVAVDSPRGVIREIAQRGWIPDARLWMDFLDARNLAVQTYNEALAQKVYETSKRFSQECAALIARLKSL